MLEANIHAAIDTRTGSRMDKKHHSTLIEWSSDDGCFIGSAYPLAGQCCHGETRTEVAGKLETIIEDLLDDPDWLKNVPEITPQGR